MKILNIAYSQGENDKVSWSGTTYNTFHALRTTGYDVDFLAVSPYAIPVFTKLPWYLYRLAHALGLTRKTYLFQFSARHRDAMYRKLRSTDFSSYDYIFVTSGADLVSAVSALLRERGNNAKIVLLSDAPFCGIEDYYPTSSNLYRRLSREANAISREAFSVCSKVIVSSDWAKQQAVQHYGIDVSKIVVIEFGANLQSASMGHIVHTYPQTRPLNIFFSGVEWERKGGDVAVACCAELIRLGIPVTLHIVGAPVPDEYTDLSFIRSYGFLNKNIPAENEQYLHILEDMDILLFPSWAECSAIVLCEAAGYGLPVFCYDTGGVGNYVVNGINGIRLPLTSKGKDFADAIQQALVGNHMGNYSTGAQRLYRERLNWATWAQRVRTEVLT